VSSTSQVQAFASLLHREALKSRGFKKTSAVFTREAADYVEIFQIQASSWNTSEEPSRFYVNVGVRFLGPNFGEAGSGNKPHAQGRLEAIVSDAPSEFVLGETDPQALVLAIAHHIDVACAKLPTVVGRARERAREGLFSPLPVPDAWLGGAAT
jgi:hypothetical protein